MWFPFRSIAVTGAVLVLAACGGAGTSAPGSSTITQPACTQAQRQAMPGGVYPQVLTVDQSTSQRYWTVVPPSFDSSRPAPLYLLLAPGTTGDASEQYEGWGSWFSNAPGLLVVADGPRYGGGAGSVASLNAVVDRVESDYCVDVAHVHVIGASSSATAAMEFVCANPDRLASLAESIGIFSAEACPGSQSAQASSGPKPRAVPIVAITGVSDNAGVSQSLSDWATIYNCEASPVPADLGAEITRTSYQGCAADLVLYYAPRMGHQFPMHVCAPAPDWFCAPYKEIDAVEIWTSFFASHPLL